MKNLLMLLQNIQVWSRMLNKRARLDCYWQPSERHGRIDAHKGVCVDVSGNIGVALLYDEITDYNQVL